MSGSQKFRRMLAFGKIICPANAVPVDHGHCQRQVPLISLPHGHDLYNYELSLGSGGKHCSWTSLHVKLWRVTIDLWTASTRYNGLEKSSD